MREAAQEVLRAKLYKAKGRAGEVALLLMEAYLSGLFSDFAMYIPFIDEAIQEDGDFVSMADCAYYLSQIEKANQQADSARSKSLSLFSVLDGGEPGIIAEKLIDLYTLQPADQQFIEALELYLQKEKRESQVEGAVFGLLTSLAKRTVDDVMQAAEGYFYGSGDMQKQAPLFLHGLFAGAKDIFYITSRCLTGYLMSCKNLMKRHFCKCCRICASCSVNSLRLRLIRSPDRLLGYMTQRKKR